MTRHLRRSAFRTVAILAIALSLAACSSGSGGSGGSGGAAAPAPSAPPGGAVIVAHDLKFDRQALSVPANQAAPLLFDNRDSVPHNVAVFAADGTKVFTGETFNGPASRTYELPSLTAGSYRFQCDVHPDMKGTLTAG